MGVQQFPMADGPYPTITVAGTAPPAPLDGDIWVDTNPFSSASVGMRNVLINGDFRVWQRTTSTASGSNTLTGYAADRWHCFRGAYVAGGTVSRQTGTGAFGYCARVQRDSGNTSTNVLVLSQALETSNSILLRGDTLTVSFWARAGANYSASSSALTIVIAYGTGTDQPMSNGFTGHTSVLASNVTLTTSWQRFALTSTAIPSNATQIGVQAQMAPTGTASTNDWFEITGVQLEQGSTATPFEVRPYGMELSLCQRYYYRHATGTNQTIGTGSYYTSSIVKFVVPFPTTMRIAPALDYANGTAYYVAEANGGSDSFATMTATRMSPTIAGIQADGAGEISGTVGHACGIWTNNASAYLGFNAEL